MADSQTNMTTRHSGRNRKRSVRLAGYDTGDNESSSTETQSNRSSPARKRARASVPTNAGGRSSTKRRSTTNSRQSSATRGAHGFSGGQSSTKRSSAKTKTPKVTKPRKRNNKKSTKNSALSPELQKWIDEKGIKGNLAERTELLKFLYSVRDAKPIWQDYTAAGKSKAQLVFDSLNIFLSLHKKAHRGQLEDVLRTVLDWDKERLKTAQLHTNDGQDKAAELVAYDLTGHSPDVELTLNSALQYVARPEVDERDVIIAPTPTLGHQRHVVAAPVAIPPPQPPHPPHLVTVLQRLHDDLEIQGLNPRGAKLRPHIIDHFVSSHTYHVLGRFRGHHHHDPPLDMDQRFRVFSNHFLRGLLHWHGIHNRNNCFYGDNCPQQGHFPLGVNQPGHDPLFRSTFDAMAHALCQYIPGRMHMEAAPRFLAFDPNLPQVLPDGHLTANDLLTTLRNH